MSYPHSSVSDFLHRPLVSSLSAYTLLLHQFRLPWSLQFYISLQTGDCEFSELLFSKLFWLPDSFAFLSKYILDAFLFTALKKKRKEKKKKPLLEFRWNCLKSIGPIGEARSLYHADSSDMHVFVYVGCPWWLSICTNLRWFLSKAFCSFQHTKSVHVLLNEYPIFHSFKATVSKWCRFKIFSVQVSEGGPPPSQSDCQILPVCPGIL